MGPVPMTATLSPSRIPTDSMPCRTQDRGSMKAAWSNGMSPASKTTFSGARTYCAMAPGRVTPTACQFSQKFCLLFRHAAQLSQAMLGSTATREPGANRLDLVPDGFHDTGELVARRHGIGAQVFAMVDVDVGPADAACHDLHQHLVRARGPGSLHVRHAGWCPAFR